MNLILNKPNVNHKNISNLPRNIKILNLLINSHNSIICKHTDEYNIQAETRKIEIFCIEAGIFSSLTDKY